MKTLEARTQPRGSTGIDTLPAAYTGLLRNWTGMVRMTEAVWGIPRSDSAKPELNIVTPTEAVRLIKPGQRYAVAMASMTPTETLNALHGLMTERHAQANPGEELPPITLTAMHLMGELPLAHDPNLAGEFEFDSFFLSPPIKENGLPASNVSARTMHFGSVPLDFRRGEVDPTRGTHLDGVIIQCTPPDKNGYMSIGTSAETITTALDLVRKSKATGEQPKTIIAQINRAVPRTLGPDVTVHVSEIDAAFDIGERPLYAHERLAIGPTEKKIGEHVASIIEDGATLQLGIGGIPDAALQALLTTEKGNFRIWSEMFSDGVIDLDIAGKLDPTVPITATFAMGSQGLYTHINDHPERFSFRGVETTNDLANIRAQRKMTSVNSAISLDVTGQVNADSIGPKRFSGIGGADDFMRGVGLSIDGKSIIAMESEAWVKDPKNPDNRIPVSKIVPVLPEGSGVTGLRASTQYFVTEWGVANLHGSDKERALRVIAIAHPRHREALAAATQEKYPNLRISASEIAGFSEDTAQWNAFEEEVFAQKQLTTPEARLAYQKSGEFEVTEKWEAWKEAQNAQTIKRADIFVPKARTATQQAPHTL